MRALRIAALVEAASLTVLLVNLLTLHVEAVTSLGGPVHGTAYLAVIACTWLRSATTKARWLAVVPGVGGLLAVREAALAPRGARP